MSKTETEIQIRQEEEKILKYNLGLGGLGNADIGCRGGGRVDPPFLTDIIFLQHVTSKRIELRYEINKQKFIE